MRLLVTGGRSEIAIALVERQLRLGHEVLVTASSEASARDVRALYEARGLSARAVVYALDPEIPIGEDLEAEFDRGVDALVLAASTPVKRLKVAHRLGGDEVRDALRLNVEGNVRLVVRALPGMIERRFGRIVFVSSVMAVTGASRHALYGMTKSAMESFVVSVAVDYGKQNVLANVLRPGIVRTERTRRFWKRSSYVAKAERLVPQGAIGEPAQIAEAFDPLLSPTSYMTGSIVTVAGGLPLFDLRGTG